MTAEVDIVGLGICTVDHLLAIPHIPKSGGTVRSQTYLKQGGGLVASALVAAQRLGAQTKVIARLGDDEDGDYIRADLKREGVDTSMLLVEKGSQTHLSVVMVDEHTGERTIISRWATGKPIAPTEFRPEDIQSAKILFIDTVTEGSMQAVQWAKEADVTVVMDPSGTFEDVLEILPMVDVPIVPERFIVEWMPSGSMAEGVQALCDMGAKIAVVTLGERGCVVCSDAGVQSFSAMPIEVVDTTGAGDAFHGGFMVGLLEGWDVPRIARFASAVGTLNCRYLGGRAGLPNLQEVDNFLK